MGPGWNGGMLSVLFKPLHCNNAVIQTQIVGICCSIETSKVCWSCCGADWKSNPLSHGCGEVRNFVFLNQSWCQRLSFVWLSDVFFHEPHHTLKPLPCIRPCFQPQRLVPPSADLRDMNNQPGLCLTANKPGNAGVTHISDTVLSLSVRGYFEVQWDGIRGPTVEMVKHAGNARWRNKWKFLSSPYILTKG